MTILKELLKSKLLKSCQFIIDKFGDEETDKQHKKKTIYYFYFGRYGFKTTDVKTSRYMTGGGTNDYFEEIENIVIESDFEPEIINRLRYTLEDFYTQFNIHFTNVDNIEVFRRLNNNISLLLEDLKKCDETETVDALEHIETNVIRSHL